eukprot:g14942.t1
MDRVLAAGVRPLVIFVEAVNNYPTSIRRQVGDVSKLGRGEVVDHEEDEGTIIKTTEMFELSTSGCSLAGFVEVGLKYDYFLVEVLNDDAVFVRRDMFFDPDMYDRDQEVFVEEVVEEKEEVLSGYTCHPLRHANGMETRLIDTAGPGGHVNNFGRLQIIGAVEDFRWRSDHPDFWASHRGSPHLFELEEARM